MLGNSIIKKIIILSILLMILYFSLPRILAVSNIAISCQQSACFVNNCQCTISGCSDGFIYFYSNTDCSGIPTDHPAFYGSSFNWQPTNVGKYYISVLCSNYERSDCTEVNVFPVITTTRTTTTITSITSTSTTTTIERECPYDDPCPADCGKRKLAQQTNNQDYYKFVIDSASNVTIRLEQSPNVDYDLYVKWDGNKPEKDNYDCKPSDDMGKTEVCTNNGLLEGTYYFMVDRYDGQGTYNLSLTCKSIDSSVSCSNPEQPCKIDCGKNKLDRSTSTKEYFTFKLASKSNVTVKLFPSAEVDYDLYAIWDKTKPTIDKYDCKSSSGEGENEQCNNSNLDLGNYYIMVDHYDGIGTYDLSLTCSVVKTTTTVATTIPITSSIPVSSSTVNTTISTKKPSTCGGGHCVNQDEDCNPGYEPCIENDEMCDLDQKCCCLKTVPPPTNYGIIIGIVLTLVLVVLVFFYLKNKSTITYEKLYRKWSRVLSFDNKL